MNIATNTSAVQLDKNKEQLEAIKTQGHGSGFLTQFKLLWKKRLLMGIRDWKQLLVQFLIPILILILAISKTLFSHSFTHISFETNCAYECCYLYWKQDPHSSRFERHSCQLDCYLLWRFTSASL